MVEKHITINDIAKKLSVSPSTVSRALNGNPAISEGTKNRIIKVANDLGYDLNLVASSMFKQRTNIIGVIIPQINQYFFSQVLSGIEEIAAMEKFRIIIAQSNDSLRREQEILKMFSSTRVDGIIASLSIETNKVDHFARLQRNGTPVVLFDRVHFGLSCSRVVIDNYEGAFKAVEHLLKTGCRRIAHLGGPINNRLFEDRAQGFASALKAHKLQVFQHSILRTDLTNKDVEDSLKYWFELPVPPDGIITASASSGLHLLHLAKLQKIHVPNQLSIISFGNQPCNEYIEPSLSAINVPGYTMGKSAAKQLFEEISSTGGTPKTIIEPIQLLIRNSSYRQITGEGIYHGNQ